MVNNMWKYPLVALASFMLLGFSQRPVYEPWTDVPDIDPDCNVVVERAVALANEHNLEQRRIEGRCQNMEDCDKAISAWRAEARSTEEIDTILEAIQCVRKMDVFPDALASQILSTVSRGFHDERLSRILIELLNDHQMSHEIDEPSRFSFTLLLAMGFNGTDADTAQLKQCTELQYWQEWCSQRKEDCNWERVSGLVVYGVEGIGLLPVQVAESMLLELQGVYEKRLDDGIDSEHRKLAHERVLRSIAMYLDDIERRKNDEPPKISLLRQFVYFESSVTP